MKKLILKKELHNKLGLTYAELEERRAAFMEKVIKVILKLSSTSHYNERQIDMLLEQSQLLHQIAFENDSDWSGLFVKAGTEGNFNSFLYLFGLLFEAYDKSYLKHNSPYDEIGRLLLMFQNFNLEYNFDNKTYTFSRKLGEIDAVIINQNKKEIEAAQDSANLLSYSKCVEEFLIISNKNSSQDYYDSLCKMKKVMERTIGTKLKIGDKGIQINKIDSILSKIFKDNNKKVETQRDSLTFILKNIHHDQEIKEGKVKQYKFNEQEYIYWWLEMNNLIYLINGI